MDPLLWPPLAQPDIPWPRQRALLPLNEAPIPHFPYYVSLTKHDLTSNNCISRPILKLDSLERGVIYRMVQHFVGKRKRLERLLRVPDGNISIEARPNRPFLFQSV